MPQGVLVAKVSAAACVPNSVIPFIYHLLCDTNGLQSNEMRFSLAKNCPACGCKNNLFYRHVSSIRCSYCQCPLVLRFNFKKSLWALMVGIMSSFVLYPLKRYATDNPLIFLLLVSLYSSVNICMSMYALVFEVKVDETSEKEMKQ